MNIGRLLTNEGLEFSLDSSQLTELTEYLQRQQRNEAIAAQAGVPSNAASFLEPEEYERAAQAAALARIAQVPPSA